jgi:hypothetical protein
MIKIIAIALLLATTACCGKKINSEPEVADGVPVLVLTKGDCKLFRVFDGCGQTESGGYCTLRKAVHYTECNGKMEIEK